MRIKYAVDAVVRMITDPGGAPFWPNVISSQHSSFSHFILGVLFCWDLDSCTLTIMINPCSWVGSISCCAFEQFSTFLEWSAIRNVAIKQAHIN